MAFAPWLRACPLPRNMEEVQKEQSSRSCNRNIFDSPSHIKYTNGRKEKTTSKGSISASGENNRGQKGENKDKAVIMVGDREVKIVAELLGQ